MPEQSNRDVFRGVVGIIAILAGVFALGGLYFVEVPAGNQEALLIAIGVVLGWGGSVVNYEFGGSQAGRKAAEAGIRKANSE